MRYLLPLLFLIGCTTTSQKPQSKEEKISWYIFIHKVGTSEVVPIGPLLNIQKKISLPYSLWTCEVGEEATRPIGDVTRHISCQNGDSFISYSASCEPTNRRLDSTGVRLHSAGSPSYKITLWCDYNILQIGDSE